MAADVRRGRLPESSAAPDEGEQVERLVATDDVVVEHILSGDLGSPIAFDQDHDEWVAVLHGSAEIEMAGETISLVAGDWLVLTRGTPHHLVRTEPGTRWLAVRFGFDRPR